MNAMVTLLMVNDEVTGQGDGRKYPAGSWLVDLMF